MIASDVTPVARVLRETGAGFTFRDRDTADLARVIRDLQESPARGEIGARGLAAVRTRYHWERDAERLEEAVRGVTARAERAVPEPAAALQRVRRAG